MITTFENRVSIQFIAINSDVNRFNSVFNATNARYIMLALSVIISALIIFGKVVEAHQEVIGDSRKMSLYFVVRILVNLLRITVN